ncbi:hypothetical protein HanRHA438_Chr08g0327261 [Helianthus annuus]|nr:hypothetical protein HanRHA438_Chr08g0327261 [Helianthus annuus]
MISHRRVFIFLFWCLRLVVLVAASVVSINSMKLLSFEFFPLIVVGRWIVFLCSKAGCINLENSVMLSGSDFVVRLFVWSPGVFIRVWAYGYDVRVLLSESATSYFAFFVIIDFLRSESFFLFGVLLVVSYLFSGVPSYTVWVGSGLGVFGWVVEKVWRLQPNSLAHPFVSLAVSRSPVRRAQVKWVIMIFSADVIWSGSTRPNVQSFDSVDLRPNSSFLYRPSGPTGLSTVCSPSVWCWCVAHFGLWDPFCSRGVLWAWVELQLLFFGRPTNGFYLLWIEGPSDLGVSYRGVIFCLYLGLCRNWLEKDITPTRSYIVVGFIWFSFWWSPMPVLGDQVVGPTEGYAPS